MNFSSVANKLGVSIYILFCDGVSSLAPWEMIKVKRKNINQAVVKG